MLRLRLISPPFPYAPASLLLLPIMLCSGCRTSVIPLKERPPESAWTLTKTIAFGPKESVLHLAWNPQSTAVVATENLDFASLAAESRLVIVYADGTKRELTTGYRDSQPQWSPDGNELVFVRGAKELTPEEARLLAKLPPPPDISETSVRAAIHKSQLNDLWITDLGGHSFPLTPRSGERAFMCPRWSPTRNQIGAGMLDMSKRGFTLSIWLGTAKPGDVEPRLFPAPKGAEGVGALKWDPSGTTLAAMLTFIFGAHPLRELQWLDLTYPNAGQWRRLTDREDVKPGQELFWSKRPPRIQFSTRDGGELNLWTISLDTGVVQRFCPTPAVPDDTHEACWNSIGTEALLVEYTEDREGKGSSALFLVGSDGQPRKIYSGGRLSSAAWSPDGKTISVVQDGNKVCFLSQHG